MKIGFDNDKYLKMQSSHIMERISKFDNKLYLEFGGKLFDDYHASRVLPGFQPDSKMRMLKQLSDQAEIVIVISAEDIEKNKIRGDLGITYDVDVLRLMSIFKEHGLYVGSVVITKYTGARGKSGTSDASAEFMAKVRALLDGNDIVWQSCELGKVDAGGGGTVAMYLAALDIDVVDLGVPVLSMHSPFEVVSKLDVYMAFRAFKAFFEEK